MTSYEAVQRLKGEAVADYIERLRDLLRARKADEQAEFELKRHLEETVRVLAMSKAPASVRNEMHRHLTTVCHRLGTLRGQVHIIESLLVTALNS
ncbi:MAG: hypothetical protein QM817_40770 [Archangium sp.]